MQVQIINKLKRSCQPGNPKTTVDANVFSGSLNTHITQGAELGFLIWVGRKSLFLVRVSGLVGGLLRRSILASLLVNLQSSGIN